MQVLKKTYCTLLLLFASILSVNGQADVCIDFDTVTYGEHPMPEGWTVIRNNNTLVSNTSDAYVTGYGYYQSGPKSLYIYSSNTLVATPNLGIDFTQGAVVSFWCYFLHTGSRPNYSIIVGTMDSPLPGAHFHPLDTIDALAIGWKFCMVDLTNAVPGDRYLAFSKRYGSLYLDDIKVGGLCGTNYLTEDSVTADSAYLSWSLFGNPQAMLHMIDLDSDDTVSYPITPPQQSISVPHNPDHPYRALMLSVCDTVNGHCSMNTRDSIDITRYDNSSCINLSFLRSNRATPYYGTFANPYANIGVSPNRHTVNTDTTMYDPVVGWQLKVIPDGESMSVRLGNNQTGAQAEAMLYDIPVDTTQMDMLILKYAAVMQNPGHDSVQQPRFRIEMLDDTLGLIEPAGCNSADFVASTNLGWNFINSGQILWKDWTIVGIDLSGYHGRTVHLRLTTYDCSQGGHYGYAYYTLSCAQKTIALSSCENGDSNRLSAPEGFTYRWHLAGDDSTLSTQREVMLPIDNNIYYCHMGFVGNPTCEVTLSVLSRLVKPVALFDYSVARDSCRFKVTFDNQSFPTDDSSGHCTKAWWTFQGADTSTAYNPVVYWPDTGTYMVTLISGMDVVECTDTLTLPVHLTYGRDTVTTSICADTFYTFVDSTFALSGTYDRMPNCDSILTLRLTVFDTNLIDTVAEACVSHLYRDSTITASGTYRFTYPNIYLCDSTYRLQMTIHPAYELKDSIVVCPWRPFLYEGTDYGHPTQFDTVLHTQYGCDSLIHVQLVPRDSTFRPSVFYRFGGDDWTDSLPIRLCTPDTLFLLDTTPGATDWIWTLYRGDSTFTATDSTAALAYSQPLQGIGSVNLRVTSDYGCEDTVDWNVYAFATPVPDFQWDPHIPVDVSPEVQLINLTWPDGCDYLWWIQREPGSLEVDSLTEKEPVYHWQGELPQGDFDVRLLSSLTATLDSVTHTCIDSMRYTVTIVTSLLQFPNLVTPNGDGVNDTWEVVNLVELGRYPMNELWIYDAWGKQVFHAKNIRSHDRFWDPAALHAPDGTYYFRFMGEGLHGVVRYTGLIEVVR